MKRLPVHTQKCAVLFGHLIFDKTQKNGVIRSVHLIAGEGIAQTA